MAKLPILTPREREMLTLLCEDLSYDEIAERLKITTHAVKFHLKNLREKTGISQRVGLVPIAIRLGLWSPPAV